ncbi:rhamnulokinase family protein [Diplocloster hominis]|uniref:rhamnulokinase n=1 Tax=Diplocloster hominis TaxID=3079010 RepID=UPI0031BB2A39
MDNYIIVDLGASNGRVIVANYGDEKFDFDIVYRFDNVPVFANEGEYFWDILRILSDVKTGIQKALKKYPDAHSVAIDSFGCDFGFIDEEGRLMGNPLHYRDESQHRLSAQMHSILSEEELFELSQGPCNRIMGIYKLYSLKEKNASEYRYGAHLLMIPDLLNYFLTGKVTNEFTNATMTLMVDQKNRCWETKICEKLGLRSDLFTKLSEPGTILGPIKPSVCEELGIHPIQVVIPATHDTASAVSGIPVVENDKTWGFVSLGTWALAGLELDGPMTDPAVVPLEFGNEGGVAGKSMLLKNINGLWVIQQCRKKWNHDAGREISWDDIVKEAQAADDLNCVFDVDEGPFGEFQPDMPGMIQKYCRETYQDVPQTLGEVARCAYKSLALTIRKNFEAVTSVTGDKLELLQLVGGGTQNHMLCQWIADAMGIPAVCGPTETTAVGNLIFQLIADQKIRNVEEGRALCAKSSELYHCAPADREYWENQYKCYLKILERRKL